MDKHLVLRPVQDKLNVFVSSRIAECREERKVVREAIDSINHNPVLFEHLGARAYSARELYISRLRAAQVMIAIYRDGYGYIDTKGGMEISGLEDEYRFARKNNIDVLFYVHRDTDSRDPKLAALIQEAEGHSTVAYYSDPNELRELVRNDLTSFITEKVLRPDAQAGVLEDTAQNLLARTVVWSGAIVPRPALITQIDAMSATTGIVQLVGDAGVGKTTIAALFAARMGGRFLRVTGLAPKELFSICASALGGQQVDVQSHRSLMSAFEDFRLQWRRAESALLVVDECDYIDDLVRAIQNFGGASSQKRLIVTTRDRLPDIAAIHIAPLSKEELQASDVGIAKAAPAIAFQRAVVEGQSSRFVEAVQALPPVVREFLTYLAMAPEPLSAASLIELHGEDTYSIERLDSDLSGARQFVDDSPRGFRIVHHEIATAVLDHVRRSPQKVAFYSARLAQLFLRADNLKLAYEVARLAEDGSEAQYSVGALRQAVVDGDWRRGVQIANDLLIRAKDREMQAEVFRLNIQLTYPLELMGDVRRSDEVLETAKQLAETLGPWAKSMVDEAVLSTTARRTLSSSSVSGLEELYKAYESAGELWHQARIGLELSALYMSAKNYEKSIVLLKVILTIFQDLGDDYGVELAQRNLASSLFAEDANSAEGQALLAELETKFSELPDTRRQRAWVCNILARQYRRVRRYEDAQNAAREAIELAEALGDEYLTALNLINLGNALADDGKLDQALEEYRKAGVSAQRCTRRDLEADASRLSADKLNDQSEEAGSNKLRLASQAKSYAEHSLGLLEGSVHHYGRSQSFVELGRAQETLGDELGAAASFFAAAKEALLDSNFDLVESGLLHGSRLTRENHPIEYTAGLADALDVTFGNNDGLQAKFLTLVSALIRRSPRDALVRLVSTHLYELRAHLREFSYDALALRMIEIVSAVSKDDSVEKWRVLYAAIVVGALLKDSENRFLFDQLSRVVSRSGSEVFAREEHDYTQLWTLYLRLGEKTLTISISAMDASRSSQICCLTLATFIKAFEPEFSTDLPIASTASEELTIYVATYDAMPQSMRTALDTQGVGKLLEKQNVVVTRPADFDDPMPTAIILSQRFGEAIKFGEREGGALQVFLGLTLIEIVFQLLRGEVDEETIRPKVVSLVRKTL